MTRLTRKFSKNFLVKLVVKIHVLNLIYFQDDVVHLFSKAKMLTKIFVYSKQQYVRFYVLHTLGYFYYLFRINLVNKGLIAENIDWILLLLLISYDNLFLITGKTEKKRFEYVTTRMHCLTP